MGLPELDIRGITKKHTGHTLEGQRFGQLLRGYRERAGLSQRRLASVLRVDESTIARIEAGTRKPFRDISLYQHFLEVPGFNREEVKNLLSAEDALGKIMDLLFGEKKRPTPVPTRVDKGGVHIDFSVDGTRAHLNSEEERAVSEILKQYLYLCLSDFLRHRADV